LALASAATLARERGFVVGAWMGPASRELAATGCRVRDLIVAGLERVALAVVGSTVGSAGGFVERTLR